jgi:hypothetical protein
MQMKATQHVHLLAVDDVEQSLGKPPQDGASHVTIDPLIERRVGMQVALDAGQLFEEVDT